MSRLGEVLGSAIKGFAVVIVLCSSSSALFAQYPQQSVYVCQTQTFWCTFVWAAGVQNNTPCYCNTPWGPVGGASINPNGVPNAPQMPTPQQRTGSNQPPPSTSQPGQVTTDDCYKGLGNCPGSFRAAATGSAASRGGTTPSNGGPSTSPFGAVLQQIIDAAGNGFGKIQGALKSSSSTSSRYETTIAPSGFDGCTLFVPTNASRRRWVSCWAPDDMSFSRLVQLVSDALRQRGTSAADGQTWMVGDIEITVDRGTSGLSFDVYERR